MKAGTELDALIAENVMGKSVCKKGHKPSFMHPEHCFECGVNFAKPYSTDMTTAWKVVEKCLESHSEWVKSGVLGESPKHFLLENYNSSYKCRFGFMSAVAETAQHAICLTALKVKGIKIEMVAK